MLTKLENLFDQAKPCEKNKLQSVYDSGTSYSRISLAEIEKKSYGLMESLNEFSLKGRFTFVS